MNNLPQPQKKSEHKRGKSLSPLGGHHPGIIGRIFEDRAAAYLSLLGYRVFQSYDPSESCDLVVAVDGRSIEVEVRANIYKLRHKADVLMAWDYEHWRFTTEHTGRRYWVTEFAEAMEQI